LNKQSARQNLMVALRLVVDGLEYIGIPPLKERDSREPGKQEKEEFEDLLRAVVVRHFGRQRSKIKDKLELYAFMQGKAIPFDMDDIYEDEDFISELMALLQRATKKGIALFGKLSKIQIDWTLTNTRAWEWAKKYTYDLVDMIDTTTRKVLQSIIPQFIETPGMTIRDVMDMLPFDEERAQSIAVTEITRAYATANQLAGEDLKKEFPDVRVVKIWYTNNDDRVCDICGPLEGMEVEIDEFFTTEDDKSIGIDPPAHVNCRCWTTSTTALADLEEK
jgi:hypothetical protein